MDNYVERPFARWVFLTAPAKPRLNGISYQIHMVLSNFWICFPKLRDGYYSHITTHYLALVNNHLLTNLEYMREKSYNVGYELKIKLCALSFKQGISGASQENITLRTEIFQMTNGMNPKSISSKVGIWAIICNIIYLLLTFSLVWLLNSKEQENPFWYVHGIYYTSAFHSGNTKEKEQNAWL